LPIIFPTKPIDITCGEVSVNVKLLVSVEFGLVAPIFVPLNIGIDPNAVARLANTGIPFPPAAATQ